MQRFDLYDIGMAIMMGFIIVSFLLALLFGWLWIAMSFALKRRRRWPTSQHRSFFSDCKRVPEE
jgi:hypothetical protein